MRTGGSHYAITEGMIRAVRSTQDMGHAVWQDSTTAAAAAVAATNTAAPVMHSATNQHLFLLLVAGDPGVVFSVAHSLYSGLFMAHMTEQDVCTMKGPATSPPQGASPTVYHKLINLGWLMLQGPKFAGSSRNLFWCAEERIPQAVWPAPAEQHQLASNRSCAVWHQVCCTITFGTKKFNAMSIAESDRTSCTTPFLFLTRAKTELLLVVPGIIQLT